MNRMMFESDDIELIKLDNEFAKALTIYEMVDLQYEQDLRDAEVTVVTESLDDSELEALYSEAEEKTNEKKEGIFKKMLDIIKGFFKSIKDFLFGAKKADVDDNEVVEVSSEDIDAVKQAETAADKIKKAGSYIKSHAWAKALAILAGVAVATGAGAVVYKKITKKELKSLLSRGEKASNDIEKTVDTLSNSDGSSDDKTSILTLIKKVLSPVTNLIKRFTNKITGGGKSEEKAKSPEASAAEKKAKDLAKNGIIYKKVDGVKYVIDTFRGTVTDSKGNSVTDLPSNVQSLVNKYKGKIKTAERNSTIDAFKNSGKKFVTDKKPGKIVVTRVDDKGKAVSGGKYVWDIKKKTWNKGNVPTDVDQERKSFMNKLIHEAAEAVDEFIVELMTEGFDVEVDGNLIYINE